MANHPINWHLFDSTHTQAIALASTIADQIRGLLEIQDQVLLSVPGGNTPQAFLQNLSQQHLDWSRVLFLLNDERWVPLEHPQSNEAMLKKNLAAIIPPLHIISLYQDDMEITTGTHHLNQHLNQYLHNKQPLTLDICIVGMGEDAHTASIFPDMEQRAQALDTEQAPQFIVSIVPNKEPRVSLNLSALLSATHHYLLIKGNSKKSVLEEVSRPPNHTHPDPKAPISYLCQLTRSPLQVYYSP